MKLKKLKKKIRQLEKRLGEDALELAKLKSRLQKAETANALKAARKSAARATSVRPPAKKPKKKLNLSPERRAQLSAAMKARWAAKRAAEGNSDRWIKILQLRQRNHQKTEPAACEGFGAHSSRDVGEGVLRSQAPNLGATCWLGRQTKRSTP